MRKLDPMTMSEAANNPPHTDIRAARVRYAATSNPKDDFKYDTNNTMDVKNPAQLVGRCNDTKSEHM